MPEGVDTQGFFEAFQECGDLAPSEAAGEGGQAFPAYLSCLGDHGVAVPEPASEGQAPSINRDDPAFEEANSICGVLLPDDDQTTTTTTTTTTTEG